MLPQEYFEYKFPNYKMQNRDDNIGAYDYYKIVKKNNL